jgi:tetratricopeptide (TPR) repeat protein
MPSSKLSQELMHARSLSRQGRLLDAEVAYRVILGFFGRNFSALQQLGRLRLTLGDPGAAVELLQKALALRPSSSSVHRDLGDAFLALNEPNKSLDCYRRALSHNRSDPNAHNNLGIGLKMLGFFDEAVEAFHKAIELDPRKAGFYWNLVHTKRSVAGDAHLNALTLLCKDVDRLAPADQIALHFALGKAYSDLGLNQLAFEHVLTGNTLARRQIVYDEKTALGEVDRIRRVVTAEFLEQRRGCGNPSRKPIFIFGMPRSGTTLVEQILASHPEVSGAGELNDWNIRMGIQSLFGNSSSLWEALPRMRSDHWRQLGLRHVARLEKLGNGAPRITDKTLSNTLCAGLIRLALPNAALIHVRRNPVDTCLSCFSILFRRGLDNTYDLGEIGRYYSAYERLMEHWQTVLPDDSMLEIRYEDLVADLPGQVRRLLNYCGLSWNDACLSFHRTRRAVATASSFQVRQQLYSTSVRRWRPPDEVLQPLTAALGRKWT